MSTNGRPREFKDEAVIDAAMEVFWEKGYEASSTQELCERTGLGKGSLYNAFGSKHELFEQVLRRYSRIGLERSIEILGRPIPVKERLRALFMWAIDMDFADPNHRGCLAVNVSMERAGRDPMVERTFGEYLQTLEKHIIAAIEAGIQSGEISGKHSAIKLAQLFLSSYYGLRVLNSATLNRDRALQIVESTLDVMF
ncbi:TetR/AcrR family transcriptional regulator [Paenibacillus ihbetae]|uniref:TetR family transcriptional regulator n=1 Tax=Paenibacillus ihbetae TaxID=1870820 RepID=A0A1B2E7N4_9BACL|nr:TetR/AcrR family transcriptional regulator [Paenibacillus ihbetae]ANY75986.1 TetR family transcriptional regulator [Paenibacillus ihbetae]OOC61859.1 TetR family transcriptional regulator [Paenibacillus ihbetae]